MTPGEKLFGGGLAAVGAWLLFGGGSAAASSPSSSPSSDPGKFGFDNFGGGSGDGVGGRALVASWPNDPGPKRERAIYDAVAAFNTRSINWVTITSSANGHTLDINVMDDVLAVGNDADWVRASMSHRTAELIARAWPGSGAYLCTSKIADLIAEYAIARITPSILTGEDKWNPQTHPGAMSTTAAMLAFNDAVEKKRAGAAGLLSDAGKYWVNTPRLGTPAKPAHADNGGIAAANYGFYPLLADGSYAPRAPQGTHATQGWSHGPGQWAVWQNVGLKHDISHADYSQTLRMVARIAMLDGNEIDLADVAINPQLCALVSDEGPVLMRHPGIPPGTQM